MTQKTKSSGKKKPKAKVKSPEITITDLGKSVLIEEDLLKAEGKYEEDEAENLSGKNDSKLFYRKFVVRCEKCMREFEHETDLQKSEQKVTCPSCSHEHIVMVLPMTKQYAIRMPEHLTAVKHAKEED